MQGYHDDTIIAFSLALIGIDILHKYITWLNEYNYDEISIYTDIPSEIAIASSIISGINTNDDKDKKEDILLEDDNIKPNLVSEKEITSEDIKKEFDIEEANTNRKRKGMYRFITHVSDEEDEDVYIF